MCMSKGKKNGFTLVELLAVVVILGIIMVISIPAVTKWIDSSKVESKESMKKNVSYGYSVLCAIKY